MPWLVAEVSQEIESIITSRDVITGEPLSCLLAAPFFCHSKNVRCRYLLSIFEIVESLESTKSLTFVAMYVCPTIPIH